MYVIAIGWLYVAVMAAIAEGMSPQGTVLGAFMTLMGWGVLPLALVLYIVGTPARKRRLREREARQDNAAASADDQPEYRSSDDTQRKSDTGESENSMD